MTIEELKEQNARMRVLLQAAVEIIEKSADGLECTADYDGTTCDGYCLVEDIGVELSID